jgi:hypothetical protein
VNVDDVVAVAEQPAGAPVDTSEKLELQQRAEERAAQVLAARRSGSSTRRGYRCVRRSGRGSGRRTAR